MTTPQNSVNNLPVRRVGAVSSGITLVLLGILLLIRTCFANFDVEWLCRFAPLMLVALGIEIITSSAHSSKYVIKYDFAAVMMCIFVMACSLTITAVSLYYTGYLNM